MEDVLEEIVGDIWDETDEVEDEVVEKAEGEYELDGDMSISDFLELIGLSEELRMRIGHRRRLDAGELRRFPEGGRLPFEDLTVTVLAMDSLGWTGSW